MSREVITTNLVAGGNILPQSFVKMDPSNGLQCLQAGSGDTPVGISGNWSRFAGGTAADDGNEAIATEFPEVRCPGSICPLVCGTTGTWTTGVFLKPDSLGYGTPVTSATDIAGAFALAPANPGEAGRVITLMPGGQGPGTAVTSVVTTAVSLTATPGQSGFTFIVTATGQTITLPTAVVGLRYKVVASHALAGGSLTVAIQGTDEMNGNGFTVAVGKGATDATVTAGDFIEVTCLAANQWYITAINVAGNWTRVS